MASIKGDRVTAYYLVSVQLTAVRISRALFSVIFARGLSVSSSDLSHGEGVTSGKWYCSPIQNRPIFPQDFFS